jgi:ribosomal protein S18 acetylase RimI-like enzyme
MWPFSRPDLDKIDLHLQFWTAEPDTPYTLRLTVDTLDVVEALGVVRGADFRLSNISTVPAFRGKGLASLVVGTLIGAARTRQCATFTIEDVSPRNPAANRLYQRFGAVALPPRESDGHSDYQIQL